MKFYLLVMLSLTSFGVSAKCDQKDADKGIQSAMNECAHERFKFADNRLNIVYKNKMKELKKTQEEYPNEDATKELVAKYRAAQLAWLKYRDAQCEDESYGYYGGSMAPMIYSSCLETLTTDRIKQMNREDR